MKPEEYIIEHDVNGECRIKHLIDEVWVPVVLMDGVQRLERFKTETDALNAIRSMFKQETLSVLFRRMQA